MNLSDVNFQAVRVFNRILTPITNAIEHGRQLDAGYDAGEWSGAFFDAFHEEAEQRIATLVGRRFNIEPDKLLEMVEFNSYYCEDRFMHSRCIDNVTNH